MISNLKIKTLGLCLIGYIADWSRGRLVGFRGAQSRIQVVPRKRKKGNSRITNAQKKGLENGNCWEN